MGVIARETLIYSLFQRVKRHPLEGPGTRGTNRGGKGRSRAATMACDSRVQTILVIMRTADPDAPDIEWT